MSLQRPSLSAAPRWPVLVTLVSLVLGAHLVLLAGDISWPTSSSSSVSATTRATEAPAHTTLAEPAFSRAMDMPAGATVQVSTVRWIVPTVAGAPAPAAATVPKNPQAMARAAPRARLAHDGEPKIDAPRTFDAPIAQTISWAADRAIIEPSPITTDATDASTEIGATADAQTNEVVPALEDTVLAAVAQAKPRPTAISATKQPPAHPPGSMRLQYDVTGNVKGIGYKAQGALDWTVTDGRYDARLEMRVMLLGSRSQTSTGRIGPGGLMPERFADKSRSEKAAHFDAAQQRIRFSNNAPEVPLQPGAQDRLSLFMQLAALLQARPEAYAAGQTIEMQVAGTGDAPVWRFDVGEESTLSVPAGEFRVRHIVRQPRKEFDSTVEMWLAPSMGHMPVRLRITQANGDFADQKLMQMP